MNPFTVEWDPTAEDQLTEAWMDAVDPAAVVVAQAAIDRALERDPLGKGTDVH